MPKPTNKGSMASYLDETISGLVSKVNECMSIDGTCLHVDSSFMDACIRREILAMVQEGSVDSTDSVQVLTSRIKEILSSSSKEGKRGRKNKREELRLSKLDEWYLVQQHLVQEEQESKKRMAQKKSEEVAKLQSERRELLKQMSRKRLDQKKKKAEDLRHVRETVQAAEREATLEREARRVAGQKLKAERQNQIEFERKKREILHDLKMAVDEKEKHTILESMRKEQQMIQDQKLKARVELESVLEENQKSQKLNMERVKADKEENKRYMEEYSRMLLKQERQREYQLEKIQEIQKAQEATSACHALHAKKWIDDSVVAQQASECEKKQSEREKDFLEQQKKNQKNLVTTLNAQMEEKRMERERERQRKSVEKNALIVMKEETKQIKEREIRKAANACIKLKNGLDEQIMQQKRAIRANMGMNHLEKCLNARVLRQVKLAQ